MSLLKVIRVSASSQPICGSNQDVYIATCHSVIYFAANFSGHSPG